MDVAVVVVDDCAAAHGAYYFDVVDVLNALFFHERLDFCGVAY